MNARTHTAAITIVFTALLTLMATFALAQPAEPVRIGLTAFNGEKQVTLSSDSGVAVTNTDPSGVKVEVSVKAVTIDASNNPIILNIDDGPVPAGICVTVTPSSSSTILTIQSPNRKPRKYRGNLEVGLKDGALQVTNVVDAEDYLLGVLPAEMPDSYPEESLKAQAIAARTYLVSNLRKHNSQGFSVCDSNHCQVYSGVLAEKPKSTLAVRATSGQILMFDGKPASTMYSADCGGVTRDITEVSPNSKASYLCAVTEPDDIPHLIWEKTYKLIDLETLLIAAGIKESAGLKSLKMTKTGSGGRALEIEIAGESATATITGEKLKDILGRQTIKSVMFTIEPSADGEITIKGKGWGHGMGLCQVGAKGLAQAPHSLTYDQILAHYYPGTQIIGGMQPAPTTVAKAADVEMVTTPIRIIKNTPKPAKNEPKQSIQPFDVRLDSPELP